MSDSRFLAVALAEYESATDWYDGQSTKVGSRFVAEVEAAVEAICAHPDQQLRWNDRYRFRILDMFPYYLVFRQVRDEAVVVAVRHTSQDQSVWQGR
jgi:plasmid stabilization system protein ParE